MDNITPQTSLILTSIDLNSPTLLAGKAVPE